MKEVMKMETKIEWNRSKVITPANDCEVIMLDTEPLNVTIGKFVVLTQHFYTNDNKLIMPLFWAFAEELEYEIEDFLACLSEKEKDR